MTKKFIIYGVAGWGMEVLWTGIFSMFTGDTTLSGFTTLWMFPIYGCAVFLEHIHDIIRKWPFYIRGLLWVLIIYGIEYTSGLLLSRILGIYPWHYEGVLAIDGFVRLDYAPAWFVAGIFFERMHDFLDRYQSCMACTQAECMNFNNTQKNFK